MVNGATIMSIISGLFSLKFIGYKYLVEEGIVDLVPDSKHWYPQQKWLNAMKKIANNISLITLYQIGRKIPENAIFPNNITDIKNALYSIDIAYHMNHKDGDVLLYNSETGELLPGIGNYKVVSIENNCAIMECDTPYPCEFEEGIIFAIVNKYYEIVKIEHIGECRNDGAEKCVYEIKFDIEKLL